ASSPPPSSPYIATAPCCAHAIKTSSGAHRFSSMGVDDGSVRSLQKTFSDRLPRALDRRVGLLDARQGTHRHANALRRCARCARARELQWLRAPVEVHRAETDDSL